MRLSFRSLLLQSLPSELPAVFAFSSRIFGDTSRPPNPFLPVIFVIYLGIFSRKLGLMQQRCLHGRFPFSFFLLQLDLLSSKLAWRGQLAAAFRSILFVRTWKTLLGEMLHPDQQARPLERRSRFGPRVGGGPSLLRRCRSAQFSLCRHVSLIPPPSTQFESSSRPPRLLQRRWLHWNAGLGDFLPSRSFLSSGDVVLLSQATRGPLRCGILCGKETVHPLLETKAP